MSTPEERRAARAAWPGRKTTLRDDEPPTMSERSFDDVLAAVAELTDEAFALAGARTHALPRSRWPTKLHRPGSVPPQSHEEDPLARDLERRLR